MRIRSIVQWIPSWTLVALGLLMPALPAAGTTTPFNAPTVNWEADTDTNGNNVWETDSRYGSTDAWNFGGAQSRIDVSGDTVGTDFSAITTAYSFSGAKAGREDWDQNIPGGAGTTVDATFEIVFRLSDDTGDHVLFETGGNGQGTAIYLNGTTLKFRSQQGTGSGQHTTAQVTGLAVGPFHQIVAVLDFNSGQIAGLELFHNGTSGGTAGGANNAAKNDWDGGDNAGLGKVNGSVAGGGDYEDFDGDIAILRYYRNQLFTGTEAQQNYDSLPEPATLRVIALGLAVQPFRRRRVR